MTLVTIEYCQELKSMLEQIPGVQVNASKGRLDSFEVSVDGTLVYSKLQTGRLPDPAQVVDEVKQMLMK